MKDERQYVAIVIGLVVGFLAAVAAPFSVAADSGERIPGPIPARVIRVIDGDTLLARARIWLGQQVETRVRVADIDAPEMRGKCPEERGLARQALDLVKTTVGDGEIVLRDIQFGKFAGRVVARVEAKGGTDLAGTLIKAGLGRIYRGGKRLSWCSGESG